MTSTVCFQTGVGREGLELVSRQKPPPPASERFRPLVGKGLFTFHNLCIQADPTKQPITAVRNPIVLSCLDFPP